MNKNVLELNGLCVDYGELRAVKLLDIKINRGERFCLVGESGSDKTSVAMAVAKLLPDSAKVSGAVRMNGTDIYAADENELREIRRKDLSIFPIMVKNLATMGLIFEYLIFREYFKT